MRIFHYGVFFLPSMRTLNMLFISILFMFLIFYFLVALSFLLGVPFVNHVYFFDMYSQGLPWFSVLTAFVIAEFPFVLIGLYGAYKRRMQTFRTYVGSLVTLLIIIFILFAQQLILQQSQPLYAPIDEFTDGLLLTCYGDGSYAYYDISHSLHITVQEAHVAYQEVHTQISLEDFEEFTTDSCRDLRIFHFVLLGLAGFVLPLAGFGPCLGVGARYAHQLLVERREISIEITTAPFGGNQPTTRVK